MDMQAEMLCVCKLAEAGLWRTHDSQCCTSESSDRNWQLHYLSMEETAICW